MAEPSLRLVLLLLCFASICIPRSSSSSSSAEAASLCPRSGPTFLDAVKSQCPRRIDPSLPLEVSGETLEKELSFGRRNACYAVLFYASRCPFSNNFRATFNALSSMFPQIKQFAVEKSSSMPSVFSRYGIHGFPAILLVNETSVVRYRGPKVLSSLVDFYKETTGYDPVAYFDVDQPNDSRNERLFWQQHRSLRAIASDDPFLAFGVLFILVKMAIRLFPAILSRLRALWAAHAQNLNLGIVGAHVLDIKRLWNKLRSSNKTRNFSKGASNARVWASLASVSLGETSSSRPTPLGS